METQTRSRPGSFRVKSSRVCCCADSPITCLTGPRYSANDGKPGLRLRGLAIPILQVRFNGELAYVQ
jgi:hypothetical protein